MQSSAALSKRTAEHAGRERVRAEPAGIRPTLALAETTALTHPDSTLKPQTPAAIDARTRMLLHQPIARTIVRLAIPNATVMLVQILIGLLEVYFVSQTGVDGLAGAAPVFSLVSLNIAIAHGPLAAGFVTAVSLYARTAPTI